MRRLLVISLFVSACGGNAASTTTTSPAQPTTPSSVVTTVPDTTTTTTPPTTTTTLPEVESDPLTATPVTTEEADGTVTLSITRPAFSDGRPGVAESMDATIGEYLATVQAVFSAEAGDAPGAVAEFAVTYEVFEGDYSISFRFTDYHGVSSWASPYVGISEMTFALDSGNRLRLYDLEGTDAESLAAAVLTQVYDNLTAITADPTMADSVFSAARLDEGSRFIVTDDGIEVTVTEADGLPGALGPITTTVPWETIPQPVFPGSRDTSQASVDPGEPPSEPLLLLEVHLSRDLDALSLG